MTGEATDSTQRVGIPSSASSVGNNGQGIDYNHPLFLSPTDVSGISIISFQLQGIENYTLWNRSIKLALLGRNKLGLVDRMCRKEMYGEELWCQWERANAIVLSWLLNSVSKSLLSRIAFASNASSVWTDLQERGHTKESCYKVVGYPPDFKSKRKAQSANMVYADTNSLTNQSQQSGQTNFSYGLNTNVTDEALWSRNSTVQHTADKSPTTNSNKAAEREIKQLLQGCTFTKDQYEQILMMMNQQSGSRANAPDCNKANNAGKALCVTETSDVWIVDTGAINHMVSKLQMLLTESVLQLNTPKDVCLPNGGITKVTHIDSCSLPSKSLITNMFHIPEFKYNLMSVSKITKELGCSVSFFPDFCVFQELYTGKVKEVGREEGGLYLLWNPFTQSDASKAKESAYSVDVGSSTDKESDIELWHKRLRHVSSAVLAKMFNINKYTKNQFDKVVKVLRSDNGTEFVNSVCDNMFKTLGIIHQRSCPYTPQQNGVAERKHRHLLEVTRALGFQAKIPIRFWGHCVLAAAYLINRLPNSVLQFQSPYERLYGKKQGLSHLRTIGCLALAKNLTEHDKLMPRSKSAVHMGYSEVQKGYILFDLHNNSFFVSGDVQFREAIFPFAKADGPATQQLFVDNLQGLGEIVPQVQLSPFIIPGTAPSVLSEEATYGHPDAGEQECVSTQPHPITSDTDVSGPPLTRRSARSKHPLIWLKDFVSLNVKQDVQYPLSNYVSYSHLSPSHQCFIAATSSVIEPTSYAEAVKDPRWVEAMQTEIQALENNNTWEVTSLPAGKKPIGCRWIYKVKYKSTCEIERFKARLVAKGYSQQEGIDYKEIFSPVMKMVTVMVVLAMAASKNWHIHQMDVFNAFLHGDLEDEIYMQLPQGFVNQGENICRLTKSLYGLKQAPRQWNHKLTEALISLKFK
ncbi:uncharacterized protein LOC129881995 [Solanum dulcamara]|uniref:uncharacterized protein LOC129881995 n=1 Tax=Solanum dulcamara TaxID=45834 RepID=UPI002485F772|nr:uncharacterized protein LOC129881995 [Solanum dulcamara]